MVDKKIVEYVADLARISIEEAEKELLVPQLLKILDYVDKLKEVDTEGVEPMRSPRDRPGRMREDAVDTFLFRDDIMNNAPVREKDYFKVPKIIDKT